MTAPYQQSAQLVMQVTRQQRLLMLHDALNVFDQAGGGGRGIAWGAIARGALVRGRVVLCAMV
jgi:hypothetical protein